MKKSYIIDMLHPFISGHLPLAAISVLQTLQNLLDILGYPAVVLCILIESMGIPLPGETMLLLAAFYSANDQRFQIPFVIICAALGAIMGDNIGFFIGRTGGKAFVSRFGRYLFLKPQYLKRTEKFYARYGDKTVFFGRFVAILRAWSAFLAGVNHMRWPSFLFYNAAGGILWATIYGLLGYYAGLIFKNSFSAVQHLASTITWSIAGVLALAVIIFIIFYYRRRSKKRSASSSTIETTPESSSEKE